MPRSIKQVDPRLSASKKPTANEKLLDKAIRHSVHLEQYKNGVANDVIRFLNDDVLYDLSDRIESKLKKGTSTRALAETLDQTEKFMRTGMIAAYDKLEPELQDFALAEGSWQINAFREAAPGVSFKTPDPRLLEAIVTTKPLEGRHLEDWFLKIGDDTKARVHKSIMLGLAEGQSVPDIARRIRGTKENKFADGDLQTTRRHAETIVRTAVNDVSNEARKATYEDNDDLISGVQYVATLDTRTSPVCQALDGKTFPIDKGPRPPQHPNCRSTTVPVLKSFEDLGIEGLGDLPEETRASMDGQVPGKVTYDDWIKKQSPERQIEALGPARQRLLNQGASVQEFVNDRGRTLTLKQLSDLGYDDSVSAPLDDDEDRKARRREYRAKRREEKKAKLLELKKLKDGDGTVDPELKKLKDKEEERKRKRKEYRAKRREEKRLKLDPKPIIKPEPKPEPKPELTDDEKKTRRRELRKKRREAKKAANLPQYKTSDQVVSDIEEIMKKPGLLNSERDRLIHKALELPSEHRTSFTFDFSKINSASQRIPATKRAAQFLEKITAKDSRPSVHVIVRKDKNGRAHAVPWDNEIHMGGYENDRVYVHEIGHIIEASGQYKSPAEYQAMMGRSTEFLTSRVKKAQEAGSPKGDLKKLKDLHPGSNYKDFEVTWQDEFDRTYMGKLYGQTQTVRDENGNIQYSKTGKAMERPVNLYSTELLSMGVEKVFAEPTEFFKKDPEMFKWVVSTLRGGK